jgi:hypothetical protein
VYRREPPVARGREGFTLHPDGQFDYLGPGRDDRPVVTAGTWSRKDDRITALVDGQRIDMLVVRESPDLLCVEWAQSTA